MVGSTPYLKILEPQFVMEKELLALSVSPHDNFVYAPEAESGRQLYPRKLERFLSFIGF